LNDHKFAENNHFLQGLPDHIFLHAKIVEILAKNYENRYLIIGFLWLLIFQKSNHESTPKSNFTPKSPCASAKASATRGKGTFANCSLLSTPPLGGRGVKQGLTIFITF